MPRIAAIDPAAATGHAKELLDAVKAKLGVVPNMTRAMVVAPAALDGYLGLSAALGRGVLPARVREQLALGVGEANGCDYCVAAHTALGKGAGLTDAEVSASRRGAAADPKADALLRFARVLTERRGRVGDAEVAAARAAGATDAELAEVVAHVALNVFTNYFNHVADPDIDFPKAPALAG